MIQIGAVGGVKIYSYGRTDLTVKEFNFTAAQTDILLSSLNKVYATPLGRSLFDRLASKGQSLEILQDGAARNADGELPASEIAAGTNNTTGNWAIVGNILAGISGGAQTENGVKLTADRLIAHELGHLVAPGHPGTYIDPGVLIENQIIQQINGTPPLLPSLANRTYQEIMSIAQGLIDSGKPIYYSNERIGYAFYEGACPISASAHLQKFRYLTALFVKFLIFPLATSFSPSTHLVPLFPAA